MRRSIVIGVILLGWLLAATGLAWAAEEAGAIDISGLDKLAATVQKYAAGPVGKAIGIGMGIGGLALIVGGRAGLGVIGVSAGLGTAFVPDMINTAFRAAGGAVTLQAIPVITAWWAPATVVLYPAFAAAHLVQDPVFLAAQALVWVLWRRRRRPQNA